MIKGFEQHFTTLANSRCDLGSTYRSIEKLHKELSYSRNSVTHFNSRDNVLALYNVCRDNGPVVYIYDYKQSLLPICMICKQDQHLVIYINTEVLLVLDEAVDTIKAAMNSLIIAG
jgi:hypothetical protein